MSRVPTEEGSIDVAMWLFNNDMGEKTQDIDKPTNLPNSHSALSNQTLFRKLLTSKRQLLVRMKRFCEKAYVCKIQTEVVYYAHFDPQVEGEGNRVRWREVEGGEREVQGRWREVKGGGGEGQGRWRGDGGRWRVEFFFGDRQVLTCRKQRKKKVYKKS